MIEPLHTPDQNVENKDNPVPQQSKTKSHSNSHLPITEESLLVDLQTCSGKIKLIRENDLTILSQGEVAIEIWKFKFVSPRKNTQLPYLKLQGLYLDGILSLMTTQGYFKRYAGSKYIFIREEENIIEEVLPCHMKDKVHDSVKTDLSLMRVSYQGTTLSVTPEERSELFLKQSHLAFNESFLGHLPNHSKEILRDDESATRFFFSNQVLQVSKTDIAQVPYHELDGKCIWRSQIIPYAYAGIQNYEEAQFAKFVRNICGREEDRINAYRSAVGYLISNFTPVGKGKAILLYDEAITDTDTPQGGTGKGITIQALNQVRKVCTIDGKKFRGTGQFSFQSVKQDTQIVAIDDVNPKFSIDRLNSGITEGLVVEGKFRDEYQFCAAESPKMVISSNTVLPFEGTTRKRRQFSLEFSDYYSSKIKSGTEEPILEEHGGRFFTDDWDEREWNHFYFYMIVCAQLYLSKGLITYQSRNLHHNRLKQTTTPEFYEWVISQSFTTDQKYNTKEQFNIFLTENSLTGQEFTQRTFSECIKKYADLILKATCHTKSSNGHRYFWFSSR